MVNTSNFANLWHGLPCWIFRSHGLITWLQVLNHDLLFSIPCCFLLDGLIKETICNVMVDHLQSRVTPWRQYASHVKVRGILSKMDVFSRRFRLSVKLGVFVFLTVFCCNVTLLWNCLIKLNVQLSMGIPKLITEHFLWGLEWDHKALKFPNHANELRQNGIIFLTLNLPCC